MRGRIRIVLGALVALAIAGVIAAGSAVPYPPEPDHALLRLSWRARGEPVQECRRLSEAELAELPIHMRRPEVCEGRILPYRLEVTIDGRTQISETIQPSGARQDRPIYVYREIRLPPGPRELSVRFVQDTPATPAGEPEPPGAADRRVTPARLALDSAFDLEAGSVLLITYDPDLRALVTRSPTPGRGSRPPNPPVTEPQ